MRVEDWLTSIDIIRLGCGVKGLGVYTREGSIGPGF